MNTFSATTRVIRWRAVWVVATLLCSLSVSFGQGKVQKIENQKEPNVASAAGKRTFESSCAPCHGLNGKGGERAPDIATRPEIVSLSDSATLKLLREGTSAGMPPFASLGTAKLSELLGYLRFLQGKRVAPVVAADAERGKDLFSSKGGCSECHMIHGAGGFLGPDLSDYGASHSATDTRNAIVNADKRPEIHKGLARATTRDGRQLSGLVRNEDNFSIQLQALDGTFHLLQKFDLTELGFDSSPIMPDNYGSILTESEMDQLVAYLLSVADIPRKPARE
jgi:cytochrome c oxidase cbb3-type subunit 3